MQFFAFKVDSAHRCVSIVLYTTNPSYSFSETDALARCWLGDLSAHVVKKAIFYSKVKSELKNINCFVLLLKYDKLGLYPELGDSRF